MDSPPALRLVGAPRPAEGPPVQVNLQSVTIQTPKGKVKIKVAARMLTSKNFQAIVAGQKQLPAHLLK